MYKVKLYTANNLRAACSQKKYFLGFLKNSVLNWERLDRKSKRVNEPQLLGPKIQAYCRHQLQNKSLRRDLSRFHYELTLQSPSRQD